jgi:hypothetical protein
MLARVAALDDDAPAAEVGTAAKLMGGKDIWVVAANIVCFRNVGTVTRVGNGPRRSSA